MRLSIDRTKCIGSGSCSEIAPAYFRQDEDGISTLIKTEVDAAEQEDVQLAASICPVSAIRIED